MSTQLLQHKAGFAQLAVTTKFKWIALVLLFAITTKQLQAQDVVDATTMTNKIMAGYQGWFRTPGDNPKDDKGWSHLFNS
ncbi:MAG TPA: hypothetical protein VGC01_11185, partial [Mucilaginibacter sp.]